MSVENEEREAEGEPSADEPQLLNLLAEDGIDHLQSEYEAENGSEAAADQRVPFDSDFHPKDGERSGRHAARLDHQAEISGHGRVDAQHQSHDREGHRAAALGGHSGDQRAENHGDGHLIAVGKERKIVPFYG